MRCSLNEFEAICDEKRCLKVLELFGGIGGFRYALLYTKIGLRFGSVVVDINKNALETYRLNAERCGDPFFVHNCDLQSIKAEWLSRHQFDIWCLSPPCQPHTCQGLQLDERDQRSEPLRHIGQLVRDGDFKLPSLIVIENVPQFVDSNSWKYLREILEMRHYEIEERIESALSFGFPNSRRRAYICCSLIPRKISTPPLMEEIPLLPISSFLETPNKDLYLTEKVLSKKSSRAMDIVLDKEVIMPSNKTPYRPYTMCFTKNYGRYFNGTGSLLFEVKDIKDLIIPNEGDLTHLTGSIRHFSPTEISNLMGFDQGDLLFPSDLSQQAQYSLIGNSLNPKVVAKIITPYIKQLIIKD